MAATDKSKAKAQESEKDEKVAGTDKSKTSQTSTAAEERADAQPKGAEKVDVKSDTEGAASGSVEGGVVRGDTGLEDDAPLAEEGDYYEGALGTVLESDRNGDQYDVPWTYVTAEDVTGEKTRTSDTDDGDAVSWNAQWAGEEREDLDGPVALVPVQGTPGQTFGVHELPNREVAERAGIDYAQWVAGLPVRDTVPDEAPRKGTPA